MRYLAIYICLSIIPLVASSQQWEVPGDRSQRLSPFSFSDSTRVAGEALFNLNCRSCHGEPGKGNYQPLNPIPGDPATDKFQDNSDGAIHYKIDEGQGLMPSFKRILSSDNIWSIISYIRSFNPGYTQSVAAIQRLTNLKWSVIKIVLSYNDTDGKIIARLTGLEGNRWTPVPDTEIRLSAQRYFGSLTIDSPRFTNSEGEAEFNIPDDLPGNREGEIAISAGILDTEMFGEIKKDTTLLIGMASKAPSLTDERAMWNINRMAPVWLLIAYPGVVLTVWAFIFFVLFQVRKIYNEGEDEE